MTRAAATPPPVLSTIIARARTRIAAEQQNPQTLRVAHAASTPERA